MTSDPTRAYPDFGCSFETLTNYDFLEIETLGPLTKVVPGQTIRQVEHWALHRNLTVSNWTDDELDRGMLPLVRSVGSGQ